MSAGSQLRTAMLAAALIAASLAALPAAAQQQPPLAADEILRRAREVLDHPSYQTELPGDEPVPGGGEAAAGGGSRPRGGRPLGDGTAPVQVDAGGFSPSMSGDALLWIVVALAMAAAAVWLFQEASRSRLRVSVEPASSARSPGSAARSAAAQPELDEIEDLARRGAYGEAVHLLLRRAIAALGRQQRLAPALTSREVLGTAELVPAARDALRELVTAAERFWFGGVQLRGDDYERCAAAYRRCSTPPPEA